MTNTSQHTDDARPTAEDPHGNAHTISPAFSVQIKDNLPPQSTSFIGRTEEMSIILEQLADRDCRLLTLVGIGGIGKTRLALAAANHLRDAFEHGVFFVSLASIPSPDEIVPAIARALQFRFYQASDSETQQFLSFLREKTLLLILDNFEHLLDGAAFVDTLLSATSAVKVLVTSREPLQLGWECLFEVGGLDVPTSPNASDAEAYSGVRLFVERARRVMPSFELAHARTAVIRICQRVGGAPLGIEIAAGWLRLMPPDAIAENLLNLETTRRDLPERQRSLRALFDHTWSRLSDNEQEVLSRLSVFRGSFTHEAAEAVSGMTASVLAGLVSRSLVQYQPNTGRLNLHEMLREYADERLNRSADRQMDALDRYIDFYTRLIEDKQEMIAMGRAEYLAADLDNIRAAWVLAVEHRDVPALHRSTRSMLQIFQSNFHSDIVLASGTIEDNRHLFQKAVEVLRSEPDGRERDLALGQCLVAAAAVTRGPERRQMYSEGLSFVRRHGATIELAYANLWVTTSAGGRFPVLENLEESLAIYTALENKWGMCAALQNMIFAKLAAKDGLYVDPAILAEASQLCNQAIALARELDSDVTLVWAISRLGWIEESRGNFIGALTHAQHALAICREHGYVTLGLQHQLNAVEFAMGAGDFAFAQAEAEAAYKLAVSIEAPFYARMASIRLGEAKYCQGNYEGARSCLELFLAQAHLAGLPIEIHGRLALGFVSLAQGHVAEAWQQFATVLQLAIAQAPDFLGLPEAILGASILQYEAGAVPRALELLGALAHLRVNAAYVSTAQRFRERVEAELGSQAVADAIAQHKSPDILGLARELLAEVPGGVPVASEVAGSASLVLSTREREVLGLLAAGRTNSQIAAELYVAVGTVKTHVHNICDKLQAQNRTEAVAIAREAGLLR